MQQGRPNPDFSRALAILKRALPEEAEVRLLRKEPGPTVGVRVAGQPELHLALVREPAAPDSDPDPPPVVVLRTRHERERGLLRREGRNFIDLEGAVHIRVPGFYLDRSDLPAAPGRPSVKGGRNPYADVASRVVRALLAAPIRRRWSVRGLAKAAEVDPSTVSRTVRELRARHLATDERPGERTRSRIRIPDPRALIEDWARSYRWLDNPRLRLAAPVGTPERFVARLPRILEGERWALTLQAGAGLIAPHAAFDVVHAYVDVGTDAALEGIALEEGWESSDSGKLVLLRPLYAESVWFRQGEAGGVPVVSPVQLVIDLWHYPVRGREQALHLIDTILRPVWESDDESD